MIPPRFGPFPNVRFAAICALALCVSCSSPQEEVDSDLGEDETEVVVVVDPTFDVDRVIDVALTMDPADWDALRTQSRDFITELAGADCRAQPFQGPYTYFHAAITMDGESLPDVGVRKKGLIGSQSTEKPGFRINLDEYVDGAEIFGFDNVTLNNSVQDPSLIRQCLTYKVFRDAGQPAPRCNFARVSMNGADLGMYVHVEPVKRRFLREHFGNDDGDLYEGTVSDFVPGWVQTFEPKNSDTDGSLARIKAVTTALDQGEAIGDVLARDFDVDSFITHLALETVTGHWDGYAGNRNNFFLYRDPSTDKFSFVTWGVDATFQRWQVDQPPYTKGALAIYILRDPVLSAAFEGRVRELLATVWDESALDAEIDRMVAMLGEGYDLGPHEEGIANVRDFVAGRRAGLEPTLPGEPGELEDVFCLIEKGTIAATFDTTWGTVGQAGIDPTRTGTLAMSLIWDGAPTTFVRSGVSAGRSEEGDPLLVITAVLDDATGAVYVPYLSFKPRDVTPGTPNDISEFGGRGVGGGLLYSDNSTEVVSLGFMEGGAVTFDQLGTSDGDPVRGSFNSSFYEWEEVP